MNQQGILVTGGAGYIGSHVVRQLGEAGERVVVLGGEPGDHVGVDRDAGDRRPRALDIWHPFLEGLKITSVVVENVLQEVQVSPGEWVRTIKLGHYEQNIGLKRGDPSIPDPAKSGETESPG